MIDVGSCEVANSAPEQITTPIITVTRGPTRLYTLATNALKIPRPTIANEPTKAVERERDFSAFALTFYIPTVDNTKYLGWKVKSMVYYSNTRIKWHA